MTTPAVAVIDIGSNSIKSLVASRGGDGGIIELSRGVEETRIGTGITEKPPRLREDAMARAIASIQSLLADAARFEPATIRLVATSAVRDAANRDVFIDRLRAATGHELRVLTGAEEARLIGRGIACEPTLRGVAAFYLFDLGGGSLEMLAFRDGNTAQLASQQLGCVRVTELCLADPSRPLSHDEIERIRAHVRETIAASGFRFDLGPRAQAVVTGGTATTFRAMRAAATGRTFAAVGNLLPIDELAAMASRLAALSLDDRRAVTGIPPARADVFPAALLTLLEVARLAEARTFQHSLYNLRYGLAADLLGQIC